MIVVFVMKLATKDELKDKVKERNEKIDSVFRALDKRHDEYISPLTGFVRRDISDSWHAQTKEELIKHDTEYKEFRHEIRNQNQKLFDLMDGMNVRINELKELIIQLQK